MMRAIRLDEVGPAANLRLVEFPEPELTSDGVLIRTARAGLIYADVEARRGTYYRETKLPWFPGREVAGEVVAVGSDVRGFAPGDRVAALVMAGGCYADYVLARTAPHQDAHGRPTPPSDIVKLSEAVEEGQALVYLVNYRIAHLVVHAWARVQQGARILIHGASGGMGTMILEEAKALQCETYALVRSAAEAEACLGLGATRAIDTGKSDYVAEIFALTNGEGVQYSFNGVGGDTVNKDPLVLAPFGEIHLYGYVAGKEKFDPFVTDRSISLRTFNADNFLRTPHFAAATNAMRERFSRGSLLSPGAEFALEETAKAHAAMETGAVIGKIVLKP